MIRFCTKYSHSRIKITFILLLVFILLVSNIGPVAAEDNVLKEGNKSYRTKALEIMLNTLGYNPGTIDYYYDAQTAAAVRQFQRNAGLEVNGVVDSKTYNTLYDYYSKGKKPVVGGGNTGGGSSSGGSNDNNPANNNGTGNSSNTGSNSNGTNNNLPPAGSNILTAEEQKMLDMINQERVKAGKKPLQVDPRLVTTARLKAEDMAKLGYIGHNSPTYGRPYDMMVSFGIKDYTWLGGENVAAAPTVEQAFKALMLSEGHRNNILDSRYTHVGIGIVNGSRYGKIFVQHFAGK